MKNRTISSLTTAVGAALTSMATSAGNALWIDVRSAEEYQAGHVPQAVNIVHTNIAQGIGGLTEDKNARIFLYCGSGHRSGIAQEQLRVMGFTNLENLGGLESARERHNRGQR